MALSIDIAFDEWSSSSLTENEVTAVVQNGAIALGRELSLHSSSTRLDPVFKNVG